MSGGFVFSCHALSGITLSASQLTLHVCTHSISFCFISCNKVPYLFVVHELFRRFTSLVLLMVIYVADKHPSAFKAGNTRTRNSRADAASSSPRPLSVTALLSSPEPPEQSCTADLKKQLSYIFLPFLQMRGIEMTGLTFPKAVNIPDSSWVPLPCLSPATLVLLQKRHAS